MIIQINDHSIDIGTPQMGNAHDISIRDELAEIHMLYKKRSPRYEERVKACIDHIAYHVREKKKEFRQRQRDIISKKKAKEQLY